MTTGYTTSNLEAFVDTVRLNSFSAVARKRGMTASSIARQVTALEHELGVSLFLRTTRALVLTEAGRILFKRSERILDDLADAKSEATSLRKEVRGLLRIGCWPTFGKKHILPHLPSLIEQYPQLRIDLDLSERLDDPVLERTDLIFRIGDLTDSTLIATRFATQRSIFAASPQYLKQHGVPRTLADCTHHRLIDKRHAASFMGWRALLGENRAATQCYVLQTDDLQAQAEACAAGLGIVHLPDWTIYDLIEKKALKPLSIPTDVATETGVYLLRNPGPATAAVEAFCKHMREKIGSPAIWEKVLHPTKSEAKDANRAKPASHP
jgi:DNA-binding transcriptional LysR family regulator